jgi:para-aminobenzoate synthetase/4-amino-4-deoxychorismate lyase
LSISSVFNDRLGAGGSARDCHNGAVFDRRRPDPALGVFETLLVLDGRPVELDAHLARLTVSLAELYPDRDHPPLEVPVADRPNVGSTLGASTEVLRISVAPNADGRLAATIERRGAPGDFFPDSGNKAPGGAISLHSLRLSGGLGPHKWVDRSVLDETQRDLADDALPLIVDENETALEASRANVFVVRDGMLLTPPADGRILPGITRMQVLDLATERAIEAHESTLSRDDLLTAEEVFLTGSVRGIEPASSLDGAPLPGNGAIAERLSTELRRAWTERKTGAEFG